MTIITCPSCNTRLKVPDTMLGRKARCTKCATVIQVNQAAGISERPPTPPPPTPVVPTNEDLEKTEAREDAPARRPGRRRDEEADEEDRPRRRRRDEEEDEEDRPRRRRRDEEEYEEDRPRRRRRRQPTSLLTIGLIGGAGLLMLGVMVGGFLWLLSDFGAVPPQAPPQRFAPPPQFAQAAANPPPVEKAPGNWTIDIQANQEHTFLLRCEARRKAEFRVTSEQNTDVDTFVHDETGLMVTADVRISKDCYVSWVPAKAQTYRVRVANLGDIANRSQIQFIIGQGDVAPDPVQPPLIAPPNVPLVGELKTRGSTWPVTLPEGQSAIFLIQCTAGTRAEVFVNTEAQAPEPDVDLYIIDPFGKLVGSDIRISKDAQVGFLPAQTGTYRVLIRNLGPGMARSQVRYP